MAHVQTNISETTQNSTSASVTLPNPVGVGNCIIGMVCFDFAFSGVPTVTDDQSNTYTVASPSFSVFQSSQLAAAAFYLGNITNQPRTITASISPSASLIKVVAGEYTGAIRLANPLDGGSPAVATGTFTAGSVLSLPSVNAGFVEDIWWGVVCRTGGTLTAQIPSFLQFRAYDQTDFTVATMDAIYTTPGVHTTGIISNTSSPYLIWSSGLRPMVVPGPTKLVVQGKAQPTAIIKPNSKSLAAFQGRGELINPNAPGGWSGGL